MTDNIIEMEVKLVVVHSRGTRLRQIMASEDRGARGTEQEKR